MSATEACSADPDRSHADVEWAEIASVAPQLAETLRRYLGQIATFLSAYDLTSIALYDLMSRALGVSSSCSS
jgi:hypothetical protein